MTTTKAKFQKDQRVHVIEYGMGTVLSYVGYERPLTTVRVQFDSGNTRDFHENKLAAKLVPTK